MDNIVCVFYVIPVETDALRLYLTDKALFFFRVPVVNNLIMQRDCVFFFLAELEAHLTLRLLIKEHPFITEAIVEHLFEVYAFCRV